MALTRATDKIIANADGNLNLSGIVTASSFSGPLVPSGDLNVGNNIKLGTASGIITATSFSGSGANLTSLPAANLTGTLPAISGANLTSLPAQATIANNSDNRVITGGSGVNLNGEANLLFDGGTLALNGRYQRGSATVQDGDAIAGGINITGLDMDSSVIMSVFGNDNDFTRISGSKSRNASIGGHTIVQNNDVLLSLKGFGSDGTNFEEAAQIEMQVDGTPNNNVMPGRIIFKTTTTDGVVERLRIKSDGRFIFETPGGDDAVLVKGDTFTGVRIQAARNDASDKAMFQMLGSRGTNASPAIVQSGDTIGTLTARAWDGNSFAQCANIIFQVDSTPGDEDMPGRIIFQTSPDGSQVTSERLRISSDGKLEAFGDRPSANAQLFQNISSTNPEGLYIQFTQAAPNTASRHFLKCNDTGGDRMVIDTNGNLRNINNSYGGFSDISLKENIVDAESQWDDIKNVKVRVFNFKTDDASEKRIGVVAQEIETVCPKVVDEVFDKDSDGKLLETSTKSVKYSVLYMKAIKCLQEAQARIETLEAEVNALKGS